MMRKTLYAVAAAIVLFSSAVQAGGLVGGWAATEDASVPEEAEEVFAAATETLLGVDYEPVALLSTQVVSGTNYCFLCRGTVVAPDAEPGYYLMYIYEDLQGNAQVLEIKEIEFGLDPAEDAAETEAYSSVVEDAIGQLRETWKEIADEDPEIMPSPYVEIKNTRIIRLAENAGTGVLDDDIVAELNTVDCIIEFMLYTNFYGNDYTTNPGLYDSVVVFQDGSMQVTKTRLMNYLRTKFYLQDFSGVVEEIIDLGGSFDGPVF